jgi:hypothetical protein
MKVKHLLDIYCVPKYRIFFFSVVNNIHRHLYLSTEKKKIGEKRRRQNAKKKERKEKAGKTTIKQEYSRTFVIILQ